jgi:putative ABC transport system permease protein
VLYTGEAAWALPAYTDMFITLKGARELLSFSDPYQALVDAGVKTAEELGMIRAPLREAEVLAEARERGQERLTAAEAEYRAGREDARREFAAAKKRLDDAEREMAAAPAQLASGRERLEEERQRVMAELAANEEALRRGEEELSQGKTLLAEAKIQLDANREQVEQIRSSAMLMRNKRAREGVAQYDQGLAQYEEGLVRILREEERLEEGKRLLSEGRAAAESGFIAVERELLRREAELERGLKELPAGRREFEERRRQVEAELALAEQDIREGWERLQNPELPESRWYVLDRNSNVGVVAYEMNIRKIADLSRIFPLFFMLVAVMVVLTTMTRMVEEDRAQIGALKALGYRKRVIAAKYLLYCGITGLSGSVVGILAGSRLLPLIIYNAFDSIYRLPAPVLPFNWPLSLAVSALFVLCSGGAAMAACYRSLREKPAALLRPKTPKPGKRIFLEYIPPLWRSLKFTYKITARNLLRYKTHFIMTVTGIAGCSALMLAAFGLRDSLVDIAHTQFLRIQKYDLRIELREGAEPDRILADFLERQEAWTALQSASGSVSGENAAGRSRYSAAIYVPQNAEALGAFISLKNRKQNRSLDFPDDAVIITEKIAELFGTRVGGEIGLEDISGKRVELTVTGITENYVGLPVYVGKESWEKLFGRAESFPLLFVKTGIRDRAAQDESAAEVLSSEAVAGVEFTSAAQESWNRLLFSISFVVLVLIVAAGGLGAIVLFNLTNININERARELATLRVLGFRRKEAAYYIYREISILTVIGAAAGLGLGILLHSFIISVAENPDLMFGRTIAPASFALSALFTLLFSALVDILMLGKITRINMAESLKSPD